MGMWDKSRSCPVLSDITLVEFGLLTLSVGQGLVLLASSLDVFPCTSR